MDTVINSAIAERLKRLEQEFERLSCANKDLTTEVQRLRIENAYQKQQIAYLTQKCFGVGKSEKLDPSQFELGFIGSNADLGVDTKKLNETTKVEYERPRHGKVRESRDAKFEHLPISETVEVVPPSVISKPDDYEEIGEPEESFQIEFHPPTVSRKRILRRKYQHKNARHLPPVLAPAPTRIIDKSYASVSLIVQIMIAKYVDHMPLYRQSQQFKRYGIDLPDNTICGWLHSGTNLWLRPIYNHMCKGIILNNCYLLIDETPVTYIDANGRAALGWLWVVRAPNGEVMYVWKDNRRHENVADILGDFKGTFQSDAYEGYVVFGKANSEVTHATCWAHVRRKFVEASDEFKRASEYILGKISSLFKMEREYRKNGYSEDEIVEHRKKDHVGILKTMKRVLQFYQSKLLPKSKFSIAINYALKNWDTLTVYLDKGQVQLSTNLVENSIRPSAVGKKNWLFMGTNQCGETAAILYSLLETCRNLKIDAREYLTSVFETSIACANNQAMDYSKLTPTGWFARKNAT